MEVSHQQRETAELSLGVQPQFSQETSLIECGNPHGSNWFHPQGSTIPNKTKYKPFNRTQIENNKICVLFPEFSLSSFLRSCSRPSKNAPSTGHHRPPRCQRRTLLATSIATSVPARPSCKTPEGVHSSRPARGGCHVGKRKADEGSEMGAEGWSLEESISQMLATVDPGHQRTSNLDSPHSLHQYTGKTRTLPAFEAWVLRELQRLEHFEQTPQAKRAEPAEHSGAVGLFKKELLIL